MAARTLDGRALAAELRATAADRAARLRARGVVPRLDVVLGGDDEASATYVRSLQSAGTKIGLDVHIERLPADCDEAHVRALLRVLGDDPLVHGVILQQPLPPHLEMRRIAESVPPAKDVDGTSPVNLGRLASRTGDALVAATPSAVMLLLDRSERRSLRGVRACVVGRSSVVGLPVALLLLARDATVTVVHRGTRDLGARTREAEVLVAAAGAPAMIRGEMVAPGATVIDVGTNYVDGRLCGDVAFDEVSAVAGEITPVPGGVGPVTNVALMMNVLTVAERGSDRA
ncbi:MAG TPA: bifunctional 5,10-methylenetetrahydrofolate dehydrogenase/5,10-methenyltetrahydrofolate cyclohydrolase [Candidatus Elarobacter sp.]|jgi:methylenetetrahydrofolate dehydrogenase (NADP+)/methenyltetrahydrofolate cyclohydrolase|nr:bifunctional 5,10-methylenetetrahydrofolate dehydrogenase/5,10-methenyltetrahydrofolate cyclohydrolase [Candidatus Elarobacter sp.]